MAALLAIYWTTPKVITAILMPFISTTKNRQIMLKTPQKPTWLTIVNQVDVVKWKFLTA